MEKNINESYCETDYCLLGSEKDLQIFSNVISRNKCNYDERDFAIQKKRGWKLPLERLFMKLIQLGLAEEGDETEFNFEIRSFCVRQIQKSQSGRFYMYAYTLTYKDDCAKMLEKLIEILHLQLQIIWRSAFYDGIAEKAKYKSNDAEHMLWKNNGADFAVEDKRNPARLL